MAMGREGNRQDDLIVTWAEMPRSPGHVFYDRLQEVLIAGGFFGNGLLTGLSDRSGKKGMPVLVVSAGSAGIPPPSRGMRPGSGRANGLARSRFGQQNGADCQIKLVGSVSPASAMDLS